MSRAKNIFNQNNVDVNDLVDLDNMRQNIANTKMTGNISFRYG